MTHATNRFTIHRLTPDQAREHNSDLAEVLADAVRDGASVGYVLPVDVREIESYWLDMAKEIESEDMALFVAVDADSGATGRVVGTVQLARCSKPNGRHRAEIRKLLVHRDARRNGLGHALMQAAEDQAHAWNLTLLVLDTAAGELAETLYEKRGYTLLGTMPGHSLFPDGTLHGTTYFYKEI